MCVCVWAHYYMFPTGFSTCIILPMVFIFTTLALQSDRPPKTKKIQNFRSVFSYACALYKIL